MLWSKQRVIELLHLGAMTSSSMTPGLAAAAHRYFGSMRAARTAAGLPQLRPHWTRERVIAVLRKWSFRGVSDIPRGLREQCKRFFGGVVAARAAANVSVARRLWSRERVIAELRDVAARDGALGANLRYACLQLFDSIMDACLAADIPAAARVLRSRTQWTSSRVIEEIRNRARSGNMSMSRSLRAACQYRFGSVDAACRAADAEMHVCLSADEILRQLQSKPGHLNTLFSIACIKAFGSVDAARAAARRLARARRLSAGDPDGAVTCESDREAGIVSCARDGSLAERGSPRGPLKEETLSSCAMFPAMSD